MNWNLVGKVEQRADFFVERLRHCCRRHRAAAHSADAHFAFSNEFAASINILLKDDRGAPQCLDARAHGQVIFELGGSTVADGHAHGNKKDAVGIGERIRLRDFELLEEVRAGALHEFEVVAVIDDAAGIGVFPVNLNREFGCEFWHEEKCVSKAPVWQKAFAGIRTAGAENLDSKTIRAASAEALQIVFHSAFMPPSFE